MTAPATGPAARPDPAPVRPRPRNAARTRQLLLDAARHRFARDGYAATTLRLIAEDAGVNIALISRYFDGKEGLFTACLTAAADELRRTDTDDLTLDRIVDAVAERIAGQTPAGPMDPMLLLLLRSSGDESADRIRVEVLQGYGERLAGAAGWRREDPDGERFLVRANLVVAAATGMMMMRRLGVEPLGSAAHRDLTEPIRDMVDALLRRPDADRTNRDLDTPL